MSKPIHPARPGRRKARAGDVLVSNRLLALATLLRRSANLVYRRELGLSEVEWRILAMVGDLAPLTLGALVEILGLDKGQLSRNVTALVRRRILTRISDPTNGREAQIALTPRGQEMFDALITLALERNRELVAGLTQSEIVTLLAGLDRLLTNARIMLAERQGQARRGVSSSP
jgi:DNA-binding MarR family transcriptional regulator